VIFYIPTVQFKYIVIIECDPILYEYYITRACKGTNYKKFTRYNTGRGSRAEKETRESDKGDGSGGSFDTILNFFRVLILKLAMLPLHTLISNRKLTNV